MNGSAAEAERFRERYALAPGGVPVHEQGPLADALLYRVGMLRKLLKKIAVKGIDEAAAEAWERGDAVFTNRFHPVPSVRNQDADVAAAIGRVEALGWKLHSRTLEGAGLQRCWNLLFMRPADEA